jgi:hypothetical protein
MFSPGWPDMVLPTNDPAAVFRDLHKLSSGGARELETTLRVGTSRALEKKSGPFEPLLF